MDEDTLIIFGRKYREKKTDIVKKLSKESLGYFTLERTFYSLKREFKSEGVNIKNMVFVDAKSAQVKEMPTQTGGCYFILPKIKELSSRVDSYIRHEFKCVIFDSLDALLESVGEPKTKSFISETIKKMRAGGTKIIFFGYRREKIKELEPLFKKIVELK